MFDVWISLYEQHALTGDINSNPSDKGITINQCVLENHCRKRYIDAF